MQPRNYPFGSRYPAHPSKDTETALVVACAMIAIVVAILNADAATMAGLLH